MRASIDLDIQGLLNRTSRTFALAIPLLPHPLDQEIGIAYLCLRVADTFEDVGCWTPAARVKALREFQCALRSGPSSAAPAALRPGQAPPGTDRHHLELIEATPRLLGAFGRSRPLQRAHIEHHVLRCTAGMIDTLLRGSPSGRVHIASLAELRAYCYVVAGIVGELLTELFIAEGGIDTVATRLREEARYFGEGLQLVNILKDEATDAADGRDYLSALHRADVLELAADDLRRGKEYLDTLRAAGAAAGIVAFVAFVLELARQSLARLSAASVGLTRDEVLAIHHAVCVSASHPS